MKEISTQSNDASSSNYIILDVREPDEYSEGHIPNSHNMPFKSSPDALSLDDSTFKSKFGFAKPSTDKTLVFSCLSGMRAGKSEELAAKYGYPNRMTYSGSFKDWKANNGTIVN